MSSRSLLRLRVLQGDRVARPVAVAEVRALIALGGVLELDGDPELLERGHADGAAVGAGPREVDRVRGGDETLLGAELVRRPPLDVAARLPVRPDTSPIERPEHHRRRLAVRCAELRDQGVAVDE
jgi:hypothetical protein